MHKMKAWRYYGRRDLRLEEVPIPVPEDDEVLIKVTRCGICQTDLDEFMAGPKLFNKVPFIPGHEFGGKIVDVGKNVPKSMIDKIVAVLPLVFCGKCKFCQAGLENLCLERGYYGIINFNGGFAEYAAIKASNVVPVDNPDIVHLGEILTVGLRALRLAKNYAFLGKNVLVTGAGPVGLATALIFKKDGWSVELCEVRKKRRDFAASLGFQTWSSIYEVPKNNYTLAIDCAGEDPVLPYIVSDEALKILPGGAIILIGAYWGDITFNALKLLANEIDIRPIFMYSFKDITNLKQVMTNLNGSLQKMTSKKAPLDSLVDSLINIEADKDNYIKVAIVNEDN
ncbi:zinc-dependent alcohol dehydrogenase [Desulfovulcanus sp.]